MAEQATNPVPEQVTSPVIEKPEMMDFPEAMRRVIEGKKITKLEWNNRDTYGLLKDTFLEIHRDGKFHTWTVNEGDLFGRDWVEV